MRVIPDRWNSGVAALRAYAEQHHNTYPPAGTLMPDGRNLHTWIANARADHQRGNLQPERQRDLESIPYFQWRRKRNVRRHFGYGEHRHATMLAQLVDFAEQRGRLPAQSDGHDTAPLCEFMRECQVAHRAGTLPAGTETVLAALPGWNWQRQAPTWWEWFNQIRAFENEHGHLPSVAVGNPDERTLALWYSRHRRNPNLPDDRRRAFDAFAGQAIPAAWHSQFERARRFVGDIARGRHVEADHAFQMRRWMDTQQAAAAAGRLNARQRELIGTLPGSETTRHSAAAWLRRARWISHLIDIGVYLTGSERAWLEARRREHAHGSLPDWQVDIIVPLLHAAAQAAAARTYTPAPHTERVFGHANHQRAAAAAEQMVARAREALADPDCPPEYRDVLAARVKHPNATLAGLAARCGLTKDAYASRLRRAVTGSRPGLR